MAHAKTYLNVPYAEKDAAKALGAKWDAAKKKWYAPDSAEIALFAKWTEGSADSVPTRKVNKAKTPNAEMKASLGTVTYAKDKDFMAYSGDQPPWN